MMLNYQIRSSNVWLLALFLIFTVVDTSFSQSSANYHLIKSVIDLGGNTSHSTNHRLVDAIGQPSPVGMASSTNYMGNAGFLIGCMITSTDVAEEDKPSFPEKFQLYQNYPNPFNPMTTIQFEVKEPCRVVLKVFNVLGHEVTQLVSDPYQAGQYQVKFDASALPSGVYFCQVQMGNFSAVKKMLLLE